MVSSTTLFPGRNTIALWLLLIVLAGLSAYSLYQTDISLASGTLSGLAFPVIGLLGLSWVYRRIRPDERIAALAHMAAITLVFTMLAAILSYTVISLWHPSLIDGYLVAADRAIGIDWLAAYQWVVAHRTLYLILRVIYFTLIPQMVALLVILNFLGKIDRAWELLWLFIVACLGCLALSAIWPAAGAFDYFHVQPETSYLGVFRSLRDQTLKVISHDKVEGIITFPSLHASLALLFAYATRGVKILFPVFVVLNVIVFIATPFIGGHHFADLWGGVVLTLVTVLVIRLARTRSDVSAP
jgi:hypothetical protein